MFGEFPAEIGQRVGLPVRCRAERGTDRGAQVRVFQPDGG